MPAFRTLHTVALNRESIFGQGIAFFFHLFLTFSVVIVFHVNNFPITTDFAVLNFVGENRQIIVISVIVLLYDFDFCGRSVSYIVCVGAEGNFIADKGFRYRLTVSIFPVRVRDFRVLFIRCGF